MYCEVNISTFEACSKTRATSKVTGHCKFLRRTTAREALSLTASDDGKRMGRDTRAGAHSTQPSSINTSISHSFSPSDTCNVLRSDCDPQSCHSRTQTRSNVSATLLALKSSWITDRLQHNQRRGGGKTIRSMQMIQSSNDSQWSFLTSSSPSHPTSAGSLVR